MTPAVTRVVLIDPSHATREPLRAALGKLEGVELAGVYTTYTFRPADLTAVPRDVTIVSLDEKSTAACHVIQSLLRIAPGAKVMAASASRDAQVTLQAFRAGAAECLLLPTSAEELRGALLRLRKRSSDSAGPVVARPGQVIAVAGAAGGVGCTSLALNLAVALKEEGAGEVALADLDLVSGLIGPWLDLEHETTLLELSQHGARLDHLLLRRSMTRHDPTGLMVLPHVAEISEAAQIDPEHLRQLIILLKESFDVTVLDTGKGLHATDVIALEQADTILFVVQLDVMSLHSAVRLLKLFRQLNHLIDKVHVVLNRVGSGAMEVRLKKVEEALGLPISWRVPNTFRAFHAARSQGEPIRNDSAGKDAWFALHGLARQFLPSAGVPADEGHRTGRRKPHWLLGFGGRPKPAALA